MVRKIMLFIICVLLIGCSQNNSIESLQFDEYYKLSDSLLNQNKFEKSSEFDVFLVYNELEDRYRYDIVINNPKNEMRDITAICIVDEESESSYPNIGIFDDKQFHLKKDYVNKEEGYYKGITLSGITKIKSNAKLYVSYFNENNVKKEMFIEVLDETR